jgi:DNA-directed RNA polymerase specialized sigma24 family protein
MPGRSRRAVAAVIFRQRGTKGGTVRVVYMKPTFRLAVDFGEVFQEHRAELVRLAAFILGDRSTGEDVVQDVFVRMHQRRQPKDGDPLPYLRAAVVNGCCSVLRRRLLARLCTRMRPGTERAGAHDLSADQ